MTCSWREMTWRLMISQSFVYCWILSHEMPKRLRSEWKKKDSQAINVTSYSLKHENNEDGYPVILGTNAPWGEMKLPFGTLKASKKNTKAKLMCSILARLLRGLSTEHWCYQNSDCQSYIEGVLWWNRRLLRVEKLPYESLEKFTVLLRKEAKV
jgi:hypothetical protein